MASAHFKVAKVVDGVCYYGEVTVQLHPSDEPSITIDENAFVWLRDVHGPDASLPSIDGDNPFCKGAIDGVRFALAQLQPPARLSAMVARIHYTYADSTEETIRCAAAYATWRALNVEPSEYPSIAGREVRLVASE